MDKALLYYALCTGLISGFILFQTSIIAPSVFKNLDQKSIRVFLSGYLCADVDATKLDRNFLKAESLSI